MIYLLVTTESSCSLFVDEWVSIQLFRKYLIIVFLSLILQQASLIFCSQLPCQSLKYRTFNRMSNELLNDSFILLLLQIGGYRIFLATREKENFNFCHLVVQVMLASNYPSINFFLEIFGFLKNYRVGLKLLRIRVNKIGSSKSFSFLLTGIQNLNHMDRLFV